MLPELLLLLQVPRSALTSASGDTLSIPRDSLAAAAGAIRDTLTEAPLPGGVATVFRFLFQVPQWIQIGGTLVAAAAAIAALVLLWRRRSAIGLWLRSRSRQLQVALGIGVLLLVAGAAFGGMKSWNYMQHENAFCSGCHIMERPFQRFAAGAGRHEDLKCHDCHQQSIWASSRQLILWVAERPEKIGTHAPVPNRRCESCHQIQGGRETWQHVRRLAGHRVHFESDSSALKELNCVKCHGAEVHKFVPSARTCEQSGCHEQQTIRLAGMAKLPEINCVTCHAFTADLPGLATRDSAVRALVPAHTQCFSCHQMGDKPGGFDLTKDPHRGSCGSCHDVHAHRTPAEARTSCTKCHADVSRNAFHAGASHRKVQAQCLTCHQPHAASADPSNCVGCHNEVRKRGRLAPPVPFDTNAVLRRRVVRPPGPSTGPAMEREDLQGQDEPVAEEAAPRVRASPGRFAVAPTDTFPHPRHRSLPCLTCHLVNRPGGGLTFQAPRGCDLCHHQELSSGKVAAADCTRCHRTATLEQVKQVPLRVRVGTRPPASRAVGFAHQRHQSVACAECHRAPDAVPPDSVKSCAACHDQHHVAERDCVQCHTPAQSDQSHSRATHMGCAACHTPATVAKLVPVRSFCLTCHAAQREHLPGRECSTCHFLATPAEFRKHLLKDKAE